MKTKWFKSLPVLAALMICMSVFCLPVLAAEAGLESGVPPEYKEQTVDTDIEAAGETEIVFNAETGEILSVEPDGTPVIIPGTATEGTGLRPFTPPGTGTVADNVTDGDGKEFYTITAGEDSVFYLIIDRQRNTQNVYFLGAVTEEDLIALAEKSGKTIDGGSNTPQPAGQTGAGNGEPPPAPEPEKTSTNTAMIVLIVIAVAGAGGAAYYFKIVKGKKSTGDDDDFTDDDDDEYGYEDEPEESGDDENEEGGENR